MVSTVPGYDAIHANVGHLPNGQSAGYVTGSTDIMWTPEDWATHPRAVRIDQSATNTPLDETADVLDYERGAATISDVAPWAKAAQANYHNAVRPGQRFPAVYMSRSNVTAVVNALVAGKVTGVGLWVADWTGNEGAAAAEVAGGNGPYPVIAVQWKNGPQYDFDVFGVPWLTNVSAVKPPPPAKAQVPPGQWKDPAEWVWATASVVGTGMDGKSHSFTLDTSTGAWVKAF